MWKKPDPGIISQLTAFTIIGHKIIEFIYFKHLIGNPLE